MFIKRKLEKYLKEHLKEEKNFFRKAKSSQVLEDSYLEAECSYSVGANINTFIHENMDDNTFQTKLFQIIDSKNLKDSDVYNKVNMDRRLFSKIRSDKNYHPSKETIILLGISLELTEKELEDLLESASYSLPMNTTYDLIIRFCFKEKIYDLNQINEFLYDHNCMTLNN